MLPAYSVGSEKEAHDLLNLACSVGLCVVNDHGGYVACDLAREQTVENLWQFGEDLQKLHDEHLAGTDKCFCCTKASEQSSPPKRRRSSGSTGKGGHRRSKQ